MPMSEYDMPLTAGKNGTAVEAGFEAVEAR